MFVKNLLLIRDNDLCALTVVLVSSVIVRSFTLYFFMPDGISIWQEKNCRFCLEKKQEYTDSLKDRSKHVWNEKLKKRKEVEENIFEKRYFYLFQYLIEACTALKRRFPKKLFLQRLKSLTRIAVIETKWVTNPIM